MTTTGNAAAGSLAGLAATLPMTAVMAALNRLPPAEPLPLPPKRIAFQLASKAGVLETMDDRTREAAAWISHGLFGAAAGAVYGLLLRRRKADLLSGLGFGLAVWAVSYPGWIARSGIDEDPGRQTWRRVTEQVVSHLVWGLATAGLTRRITEKRGQF